MKLESMGGVPPTLAFTSRCDARHLATLASLWTQMGQHPRSTSELVRLSLETLSEMMVLANRVEFVQTQGEAQEILGSMGLIGKGLLRKNLVEAIVREGGAEIPHSQVTKNPSQRIISQNDPHFKKAQDLLAQELLGMVKHREEIDKSSLNDTLEALGRLP